MIGAIAWTTIAWRLGLSVVLGGAIGLEREIHGRAAGLRTHMLVALGSALFTVISFMLPILLHSQGNSDPTRIAAQVITGVGFLGAGTILQGRGSIYGLTTAASIWLVSAIGMAVAGGFYVGALVATVFGHVVLVVMHQLEYGMLKRRGTREVIRARLAGETDSSALEKLVSDFGIPFHDVSLARRGEEMRLRLEGTFRPGDVERITAALRGRGDLRMLRVTQR